MSDGSKAAADGGSPTAASGRSGRRIRGIDRLVHMLDYLHRNGRPMRINEIAKGIGAPRSTVYEIAERLLKEQILETFDDEGRVFLGRKLYYFGIAYTQTFDLTRKAQQHLRALTRKTGETSQLCVVQGAKYAVAMMNGGVRHFKISSTVGETIPLPWTASGRLLVAHLADTQILELIPDGDFVLPDGERLAPDDFLAQVHAARSPRYFSCDTCVDSYTHCFAASVIDDSGTCVATLCLVVPRSEAHQRNDELRMALVEEARDLSSALGAGGARDAQPNKPNHGSDSP